MTAFVNNSSKDNTALQFKVEKMFASELENIVIDQEELIGYLHETKHDIHDLMGRLSTV